MSILYYKLKVITWLCVNYIVIVQLQFAVQFNGQSNYRIK